MRRHNKSLLHSASDLNAFLGCAHAVALNIRKLIDPVSLPTRAKDDDGAVLIQQAGHKHEADYLVQLVAAGGVENISVSGSLAYAKSAVCLGQRRDW